MNQIGPRENKNRLALLRCLFLSLLLSSPWISFSQKKNVKFEHLDINAGLSQNHILCILQDSRGFMWFGTRDGLNKYDGYQFTIYKNDPGNANSISNNFISDIEEDTEGNLWIATRGGGLNRYDRKKDKFIHFTNDPSNQNSIRSNLLANMVKDDNDNLWICTEDNGLDFFERRTQRFIHYRQNDRDNKCINDNNTRYVCQDREKNLWIGTYNGGLNFFDRRKGSFTAYKHDEKNNASISNNNIRAIFEDSKGRIWIGTIGGGLDLFERSTGIFHHFKNDIPANNCISANVIAALAEDHEGNIWIGTENGGLDIYDPAANIFHSFKHDEIDNSSISQNSIYSICRDNYGNMWVGTFSGGVNIFSKEANRFTHYRHTSSPNSLSNNNVLCLTESSGGKLWIGTDGGGLNLFDPATKNFTNYLHDDKNKNSISGNYILTVCEDSRNNVWIGTWADGLTIFNTRKNTYSHYKHHQSDTTSISSNNVWVVFEDGEKNIWIGTYGGGLDLYDPVKNSFVHFNDNVAGLAARQIYSIAEDRNDNLLLGTDGGGLKIFNKKTKIYSTYLHDDGRNSISDNQINYVYRDSHDNFWLNTMSGLTYFDTKQKKFTVYNTLDGLPNNVILGIVEDGENKLWISTNKGISKFDPFTKKFVNFSPADGLQSYEFNGHAVCKARSGAIYFGGINGFNEFFSGDVTADDFEPVPVFTGFEIFNKKVPIAKDNDDPSPLKSDISETKQITLSYRNSVISFDFATLYYSSQDKKQYAYKMEGFDKEWNFIGAKHFATYTNLDPGKYTFKVKGLNSRGKWGTAVSSIQLEVTPPFWATVWFRLTGVAGIVLGIVFFIRFRLHTVKAQKIKLMQKVNDQTNQLSISAAEEKKAREEAEAAKLEAELANREIVQKNKELEQFVYIASHDLQEPLRTTTSFIELLKKQYQGKLDEKADKYFSFISDSSERMKTLIKDLLDYSRLGAKKESATVDCNEVMKNVLADLGKAIEQSSAEITSGQLPVIIGYPTEIKLLFQNLIINAIKFRNANVSPLIKISAQNAGNHWQFSVKDNGIGIADQYKEKIFLIFQRLHTKSEYEGSGIGLAHSKKIVELHGGRIWIESTLGEGTTFFFTVLKNTEPEQL